MSVDLSIGLCRVISVIVRKCCGLRLAVPIANKHKSQLLHRHTVSTKKPYRWHLFDWTFSFYIVHLCFIFQTVGVQNPKHDCVQLPCCRHNTWKQWDNTWMLGKWLIYKGSKNHTLEWRLVELDLPVAMALRYNNRHNLWQMVPQVMRHINPYKRTLKTWNAARWKNAMPLTMA